MKLFVMLNKYLPILFLMIVIFLVSYFLFIRPWMLQLGVTAEEKKMSLLGDKLVLSPNMKYMQAITIDTSAESIWKYLIQVGYKRAGWYNIDFINRMSAKDYFYENNRSAERIIPELQNTKEGDKIYLNPNISLDVLTLEKNEYMLLSASKADQKIVSWIFNLKEVEKNKTRLIVRWKSNLGDSAMLKLVNLLFIEPGSAIQQSQMLKGIKNRAEKHFHPSVQ